MKGSETHLLARNSQNNSYTRNNIEEKISYIIMKVVMHFYIITITTIFNKVH